MLFRSRKQIWRRDSGGTYAGDVIARAGERLAGTPLLQAVMEQGRRTGPALGWPQIAAYTAAELAKLPPALRGIESAAYPVAVSEALTAHADSVQASLRS